MSASSSCIIALRSRECHARPSSRLAHDHSSQTSHEASRAFCHTLQRNSPRRCCALARFLRADRRARLHVCTRSGRKRDETYLHLVMDFLPDTIRSVALGFQRERQRFPIDHVRVYLYQTLKALDYVHSKRICHRDLKPDNLLVDASTLRLKLIDFGCAKVGFRSPLSRAPNYPPFARRTLIRRYGAPSVPRARAPKGSATRSFPRSRSTLRPLALAPVSRGSLSLRLAHWLRCWSRASPTCRTSARGTTARRS